MNTVAMEIIVRNEYSEELEKRKSAKVRNVFELCEGMNGKRYFVFQGNNGKFLGILELDETTNTRRWV